MRLLPRREVIGPPECPILHRWTLFEAGERWPKLMIHRFLPNRDDRDVHDHPRPFITFVLRGSYDDLIPCPHTEGSSWTLFPPGRKLYAHPGFDVIFKEGEVEPTIICSLCKGEDVIVGEVMRAGMIRRRRASHIHRTRVGPAGCWTLILMGPLRREWGFWRDGRFLPVRLYEQRFGFGMQCGDEETRYTFDRVED